MAKKTVVSKVVTGEKAQAAIAENNVKVTSVEKEKGPENGFIDYRKSRDTIIEGRFVIRGILVGDDKKRHWVIDSLNKDGSKGTMVAYLGDRKDGKGVYARSAINAICSPLEEKVEAKEKTAITV